jgi:hypothetical protein
LEILFGKKGWYLRQSGMTGGSKYQIPKFRYQNFDTEKQYLYKDLLLIRIRELSRDRYMQILIVKRGEWFEVANCDLKPWKENYEVIIIIF